MSEVVTGDAVVLDVQIAQLPVRAVSALIDLAVIFVCYVLGLMLWAASLTQFDTALSTAILIIFTVLVIIGYPLAFETATRGRSLGKIVMGLRVVSDDGGPERFRQVLFRALASVVEIWMFVGSPAVICSLLSPKAKRIGDIFAGTVVVSERGPRLVQPPAMPPSLAWWASSLQLSGLNAGQAEVARQFLSRAPQLDRQLRHQMAYRIAGDVVSRIAPPRTGSSAAFQATPGATTRTSALAVTRRAVPGSARADRAAGDGAVAPRAGSPVAGARITTARRFLAARLIAAPNSRRSPPSWRRQRPVAPIRTTAPRCRRGALR